MHEITGDIENVDWENVNPTDKIYLDAKLLEEAGRYDQAMEKFEIVYQKRESEFGDLHMETVKTKYRMAKILYMQSKYEEAAPMFEDVYLKMIKMHGPEDKDALLVRGYMANSLRHNGKDALQIYREIFEIMKERPSSSLAIVTRSNIALELCDRGKYDEAQEILGEIITFKINCLADYKSVSQTIRSVAYVVCKRNDPDYRVFTDLFLEPLLDGSNDKLGEYNLNTLANLQVKGEVLATQGDYVRAETVFRDLISKNDSGHRNVAKKMEFEWILALLLMKQEKFDEAWSMLTNLYVKMKVESKNPVTIFIQKMLARIADKTSKYEEALRLYKELEIFEQKEFPGASDLSVTRKNIQRIVAIQKGEVADKTGESYEIESKSFFEIANGLERTVEEY